MLVRRLFAEIQRIHTTAVTDGCILSVKHVICQLKLLDRRLVTVNKITEELLFWRRLLEAKKVCVCV